MISNACAADRGRWADALFSHARSMVNAEFNKVVESSCHKDYSESDGTDILTALTEHTETDVSKQTLEHSIKFGQECIAQTRRKVTVTPMKTTVKAMAQMRSSTAAASIQSFFNSFSSSSL